MSRKILFGMVAVLAVIFLISASSGDSFNFLKSSEETSNPFKEASGEVCYEEGKPVIRMYSTTSCPHCLWVKETFDRVAKEYMDAGKIIAYHWELNTLDDTLTEENEGFIPESEIEVYHEFNKQGTVPTFVLGCKYYRIGNSFSSSKNLEAEEEYLRKYIDKLIA